MMATKKRTFASIEEQKRKRVSKQKKEKPQQETEEVYERLEKFLSELKKQEEIFHKPGITNVPLGFLRSRVFSNYRFDTNEIRKPLFQEFSQFFQTLYYFNSFFDQKLPLQTGTLIVPKEKFLYVFEARKHPYPAQDQWTTVPQEIPGPQNVMEYQHSTFYLGASEAIRQITSSWKPQNQLITHIIDFPVEHGFNAFHDCINPQVGILKMIRATLNHKRIWSSRMYFGQPTKHVWYTSDPVDYQEFNLIEVVFVRTTLAE